ncbi:CD1375 family protein [Desulfosporosinus meridiei]|uniref:Uncharacterized protein n=1 Tax=Desulfosporosinus meridiei (strain ATCC BAA-275 / DSM 13257 / KCTC 12902 / NCIMB 13706 / S10) TaxID=768704 RepID=J7IWZ8_DESMD|nr:CD1375 family protein [Desulfosporosinus meridiei]AFQ46255.1 hypothetical protein Desmer_4449 [Desulfosporosinus meridiei DSM 13257]
MTAVQKRLVNAYATLVMGKRMTIEDVPNTEWELLNGTNTTLRTEVEMEVATREIAILG